MLKSRSMFSWKNFFINRKHVFFYHSGSIFRKRSSLFLAAILDLQRSIINEILCYILKRLMRKGKRKTFDINCCRFWSINYDELNNALFRIWHHNEWEMDDSDFSLFCLLYMWPCSFTVKFIRQNQDFVVLSWVIFKAE